MPVDRGEKQLGERASVHGLNSTTNVNGLPFTAVWFTWFIFTVMTTESGAAPVGRRTRTAARPVALAKTVSLGTNVTPGPPVGKVSATAKTTRRFAGMAPFRAKTCTLSESERESVASTVARTAPVGRIESSRASTVTVCGLGKRLPVRACSRAVPMTLLIATPGVLSTTARLAAGAPPPPPRPLLGGARYAEVLQRLRGVLDPLLRVWSPWRVREKRLQMLCGAVGIAALQQQKGEAVVRAGERGVELERAAVMPDRFVEAAGLGEGDRHVLENARVVGKIAQREPVRRQGGVVVALTLERQRLVEVVEAMGFEIVALRAASSEQAAPETHGPKIACGCRRWQCRIPNYGHPTASHHASYFHRYPRGQDAARRPASRLDVLRRAVPGARPQGLSRIRPRGRHRDRQGGRHPRRRRREHSATRLRVDRDFARGFGHCRTAAPGDRQAGAARRRDVRVGEHDEAR